MESAPLRGNQEGAVGAILGGIIGAVFFNLPGLLIGPMMGAAAVELLAGRRFEKAGKAGFGTFIGGLAAFFLKLIITVLLISGFFLSLPATG